MSDDINFLPGKKKEEEQGKAAKKEPAKTPVRFHLPKKEQAKEQRLKEAPSLLTGFMARLKKSGLVLRKFFAPKKKPKPEPKPVKSASLKTKLTAAKVPPAPQVHQPVVTHTPPKSGVSEIRPVSRSQPSPKPRPEPAKAKPTGFSQPLPDPEVLTDEFSDVDVNLIPLKDSLLFHKRIFRISLVVGSLLIIVVWGILLRVQNVSRESTIGGLREAVESLDSQLQSLDTTLLSEGSGIAIRQRKLVAIMSAMPRWTKFVTWLESVTEPAVFFKSLGVDHSGEIHLEVEALDYESAARQWVTFESATDWISAVEVTGIASLIDDESESEPTVNFNVRLQLINEQLQEDLGLESF